MTEWGRFAVCLGLVLTTCAQPVGPGVPSGAPASEDSSQRFVSLVGPKVQHAPPFLGVAGTNYYCLRSLLDRKTGQVAHQLYVSDSYSGAERNWNAARDGSGNSLKFVPIDRHEITCEAGCSYFEEFAANIPEDELRASSKGLSVTFTAGPGVEKTITVSGGQIAIQLAAFEAKRAGKGSATAIAEPKARP